MRALADHVNDHTALISKPTSLTLWFNLRRLEILPVEATFVTSCCWVSSEKGYTLKEKNVLQLSRPLFKREAKELYRLVSSESTVDSRYLDFAYLE